MRRHLLLAAITCASALAIADDTPLPHKPPVRSDPRGRLAATPQPTPAEIAAWSAAASAEAQRLGTQSARKRGARARAGGIWTNAAVAGTEWVSLGPTDALQEFNQSVVDSVDSGRPSGILVDPRDPNVVYLATSGGGVWKTFDFLAANGPDWASITDLLPNIAIGGLAMDPAVPDTIYIGTGDAFDTPGNTVQKSTDGGVTWSAPVALAGSYPAPNNFVANAASVRDLKVRGSQVLVASDVGLFRSTDGGATFALVPLPTSPVNLAQAMWSIVHVGNGQWLATGTTACSVGVAPPGATGGTAPGGACPNGTEGVIWRSTDGATWTIQTTPLTTGIGRITLATGDTSDPTKTVVYAWVGNDDIGTSTTVGFWRSQDGGATWADATGTLLNPTLQYPTGPGTYGADCGDLNIGHDQAWYNQAIAVDPSNPDHVILGGNLCGLRTLDGTNASPTWELVSDWLPSGGGGTTLNGVLPYVHADWHAALVTLSADKTVRAFAGTDGGLFAATNLFDAATPGEKINWSHYNRGLVTHLHYGIASGDSGDGNQFTLFSGLQDNGTRYRSQPATPSAFNQVVGGDGIGVTIHTAAGASTYFASVEYQTVFCQPNANIDCNASFNWNRYNFTADASTPNDSLPFFVHYANAEITPTGLPADGSLPVLTHSNAFVWYAGIDATGNPLWKKISQNFTAPAAPLTNQVDNITVARGVKDLFGAVLNISRAPFAWTNTVNLASAAPAAWHITQPVFPKGGTTVRFIGPSAIDFPPYVPTAKTPGQVFTVGFSRSNMSDGTLVTADQGHVYRTTDGGTTWTSLAGTGATQLPNVPVYVIKYDPTSTPAATTIYVGTEIGVYVSNDDGATWNRYGNGFPMVPVRDIYVARNQDFIRVATYGRGLWEIYPSATANHGSDGNGDFDRNQQLDWVDVAALAARLGDTPATATQPLYTWIDDLTGAGATPPVQAIDDNDLNTLLAKLGDHP